MPRLLTWNIYNGALPAPPNVGATPMDRLAHIAGICVNNNIDITCLQEVPQADLDNTLNFGNPGPNTNVTNTLNNFAGFQGNFTVLQGYAENNPNLARASNTTDGYLIIYHNATFQNGNGQPIYYTPNQFRNQAGIYLRPPMMVDLIDNQNGITTVMNWHAETGPDAERSVRILNHQLGRADNVANTTVVGGDFNVRRFNNVFPTAHHFIGWQHIQVTYCTLPGGVQTVGLDHILTSVPSNIILGNILNFTSDAYHYPIAAEF